MGLVLKLDVDLPYTQENVDRAIRRVLSILKSHVKNVIVRRSTSGHIHVYVHTDLDIDDYYWIVLLQYALGDDERRVVCNLKRLRDLGVFARKLDVLFIRKCRVRLKR